jgi:thiamine biosynthesis lipoprotein
MTVAERRFRAMGTSVHLLAQGDEAETLVAQGEARVHWYERRWSRFVEGSELRRINASAGRPVIVPADTFDLVEAAVVRWHESDGLFDPTVLDALERLGYDCTFADIRGGTLAGAEPSPGCAGIYLDRRMRAVTLPPGVRLDLGGIAKGFTADALVAWLMGAGARGALANVGGDLRVAGQPAGDDAWVISVADPRGGRPLLSLALAAGAVATSSRVHRAWHTADGDRVHHLVEPSSGRPADSDVIAATVVAMTATDAEVFAKVAVLEGSERAAQRLRCAGVTGLLVTTSGTKRLGGLASFIDGHERFAQRLTLEPLWPATT